MAISTPLAPLFAGEAAHTPGQRGGDSNSSSGVEIVEVDYAAREDFRTVQLTPPGSAEGAVR